MTSLPDSQCLCCVHFRSPFANPNPADWTKDPTCAAFPAAIPDTLLENEVDHRKPVDGDHGVRFEARPGLAFPEFALATK